MSQIGKPARGPRPSFDRDAVLDRLVGVFWENGYAATSHAMMREATGLSGSSLYNTFGDKRAIFDRVLDRYHERSEILVGPLLEGSAGVTDLITWLGTLRERVASPNAPAGCLMVATMGSLIGTEAEVRVRTQRNLERVRGALEDTLGRAAELGEIDPARVASIAASLTAAYVGILTAAKGAPDATPALHMIEGVEETVRHLV